MKTRGRRIVIIVAAGGLVAWVAVMLADRSYLGPVSRETALPARSGADTSVRAPSISAEHKSSAALAGVSQEQTGASHGDWAADLQKAWDDPANHAAARRTALDRVEQRYGRFFQRLKNVSPAQLDALKRALAENDVALQRQYLPKTSNETDADRQQRITGAEQLKMQQAEELRGLLGDEAFGRFEDYDRALPYQQQIEAISNTMRSNGVNVDEETQEKINTTYAEVLSRVATAASHDVPAAELARLSDADRAALRLRQMDRLDNELASAMAKALDAPTFRAFMDAEMQHEEARQ